MFSLLPTRTMVSERILLEKNEYQECQCLFSRNGIQRIAKIKGSITISRISTIIFSQKDHEFKQGEEPEDLFRKKKTMNIKKIRNVKMLKIMFFILF